MNKNPLTCLLVGAGIRGMMYGGTACELDADFKVVAVAETDAAKRAAAASRFNLPEQHCFDSWQRAVEQPQLADCAINATMDDQHFDSAMALMDRGYDQLLEKPVTHTAEQTLALAARAKATQRKVMICHVLRYTPFYDAVKKVVASGELGVIQQVRMAEHVATWHFATAFVRGRFANRKKAAPFILAKCCHDMDIMAWLLEGRRPRSVSSFGSLDYYQQSREPQGATDNCYGGCPHLHECPFSAERLHVKHRIYLFRVLGSGYHDLDETTLRQRVKASPYSRCVYRCDNDVVDHQSVQVAFDDGVLATFDTHGLAAQPGREIQIFGSQGELVGRMEDNHFVVRNSDGANGMYRTRTVDTNQVGTSEHDGHGGGDRTLVRDFVKVMRGEGDNRTSLDQSIVGHMIAYAAEASRTRGQWIDLDAFTSQCTSQPA